MGDEGTSIATEQRRGELRLVSAGQKKEVVKNASVVVLGTSEEHAFFWTDSLEKKEKKNLNKTTPL